MSFLFIPAWIYILGECNFDGVWNGWQRDYIGKYLPEMWQKHTLFASCEAEYEDTRIEHNTL